MAAINVSDWVPIEYSADAIQRVEAASAVEFFAKHVAMGSDTKSTPRSSGMSVSFTQKSGTYNEDASANDEVILTAQKFTGLARIADEDLDDSLANVIEVKSSDWVTSYGIEFDNATLGTTGAATSAVPFTSVYKSLITANSNTSYVASANVTTVTSAGITYDKLSEALGKLEVGNYFEEANVVVIAHPSIRATLRGVKDLQGNPIFVQGLAGTPDTIFGHEVRWTLGAKTSAAPSTSPEGTAFALFVNKNYLIVGDRSGPEAKFISSDGAGVLTDEAFLKFRARRAFAVGNEHAFSILLAA